jgi:tuberculosinol/isotuberculosinol synthase
MELETFQRLPTQEVARLVRAAGPKVCVFPINGTRRWFMLEHSDQVKANFQEAYLRITWQQQIKLYQLFFDHGIHTLLTPIFGPDLLERGSGYEQLITPGLLEIVQNKDLLDFYESYDVRVRVYGDARRCFQSTPYAELLDAFDELARRTASHQRHRLFFGICAHDPTETIAEIGARLYQKYGCLPDKRQIVETYYGEYVEPVDFFIGFDRPTAFDMPLIATGNEDLYFTISPSLYLDVHTLRAILYDHLYARRVSEVYTELSSQDWQVLTDFYALNRRRVLGLGRRHTSGSFWYPLPQVELPRYMADNQIPC